MNIKQLQERYRNGVTVTEVIEECFNTIEKNKDYNAYITLNKKAALEKAKELDQLLDQPDSWGPLFGVPVALKDNINTKDLRTTCGSRMLENYLPVYNATIVERIDSASGIVIGKTNMDEFAMGSSGETSYFGSTKNPIDPSLVPGGSSSGAATTLKLNEVAISIGSDTGGSVRLPASYCSVLGYYPSYGTISRYGVVAMANTLDQIGILAHTVKDIETTLRAIGGHDPKDMTSLVEGPVKKKNQDKKIYRIGVLSQPEKYTSDETVLRDYHLAIEKMKEQGHEICPMDFGLYEYVSPTYNVICTVESSSNMSRFDGIRFGYHSDEYENLAEMYKQTRSEGFGEEVQRRIAMGMYFLGSKHNKVLYEQALRVRELIRREVESLFQEVDFFVTPSTTNTPYPLDSKAEDALSVFDSGDFHVMANLTGRCAISIPMNEGIGGSIQILGDRLEDYDLLAFSSAFLEEEDHEL